MSISKMLIAMLFMAITFSSCVDQDKEILQPQKVQITFETLSADANGRANGDLPDNAAMLISLSNSAGVNVLKYHRVNVYKLGDSYVTEPLDLVPDNYSVTDFFLIDGNTSNILFATPLKNAPYAKLVKRALPYSFNVRSNKTNNVSMEVVDTKFATAEDFGYVTFNIGLAYPLKFSVFRIVEGAKKLTNAMAYFYDGDVLKEQHTIAYKVNLLSFKLDPAKAYKLVVKKDGYEDYVTMFTYNDVIAAVGTNAYEVTLKSLATLNIVNDKSFRIHNGGQYSFIFKAKATITIDWGHGDIQTISSTGLEKPGFNNYDVYRTYENTPDTVRIRGDLDLISHLYLSNALTTVNFDLLPSLEVVDILYGSRHVDLSTNKKLSIFSIGAVPESIVLPTTSKLHVLYLLNIVEDQSWNNTDMLDYVFTTYYNNAVARNIRKGYMYCPFIVPTPAQQAKLDYMKNNLGWMLDFPQE